MDNYPLDYAADSEQPHRAPHGTRPRCLRSDRLSAYEQWSLPYEEALRNELEALHGGFAHEPFADDSREYVFVARRSLSPAFGDVPEPGDEKVGSLLPPCYHTLPHQEHRRGKVAVHVNPTRRDNLSARQDCPARARGCGIETAST